MERLSARIYDHGSSAAPQTAQSRAVDGARRLRRVCSMIRPDRCVTSDRTTDVGDGHILQPIFCTACTRAPLGYHALVVAVRSYEHYTSRRLFATCFIGSQSQCHSEYSSKYQSMRLTVSVSTVLPTSATSVH